MFVRLEITIPGQAAQSPKIAGPKITLGRDPASQVPFDSKASSAVSWQHARIDLTATGATITDLGSSNGTFLNGAQVSGTKALQQGDVFNLGQTGPKIRVIEIATAAPVHATVAEKFLPQGMLTPPVGTKPLNVSSDSMPIRQPTKKKRRSNLGAILVGLIAVGAVGAAGYVVFNSQQKAEEKKDDDGNKQAKADPEAKDKAEKGDKTPPVVPDPKIDPKIDPKAVDPGKKEIKTPLVPDPPLPPKFEEKKVVPPVVPPPPPPEGIGKIVYRKTLRSVGWVNAPLVLQPTQVSLGTGALVDEKLRLFLTAHHVIAGTKNIMVYFPRYEPDGRAIADKKYYLEKERPVMADVLVTDPKRDLAVLRLRSVPEGVPVLPLATKGVDIADYIFTVGNPAISESLWVYTAGAVRQIARNRFRMNNNQEVDAWVIEAQYPINPGDSGGPVVNEKSEIIGVNNSYQPKAQLVSSVIDLREINVVLDQARRVAATTLPPVP